MDLFASSGIVECSCGGMKVARGKAAITEYWLERFADSPAGQLLELRPNADGIAITYKTSDGPVLATLYFNADEKITRSVYGPTA